MKLFTDVIYECSLEGRVFVPGKPFKLSLILVGKARSSLRSSLIHKQYTWLERLARGKHSSLLLTFVNYVRTKMYNRIALGPSLMFAGKATRNQCYKTVIYEFSS